MRIPVVASAALAFSLCLTNLVELQGQQTADDDQVQTQLTLASRSIAVTFTPMLYASQLEHGKLLSQAETSIAPRARIGKLDAPALLRMGTVNGTSPDKRGDGDLTYDLWLTRGGNDWGLELNPPSKTGTPSLVEMVPLNHSTTLENISRFSAALVPTDEDAGQLVLRWGIHRWTADFSLAPSPRTPEQTEEKRAEAQQERNEQNRRDFDTDVTLTYRFSRLAERHETAIELPGEARIDVLFWKKIGSDHDDFSRIATPADGEVIRLTEAAVLRLRTEVGLWFGEVEIPTNNLAPDYPGLYGLWLKRSAGSWRLVFNNEPDSWGTQHDPTFDAAEINLTHSDSGATGRPLGAALIPEGADRGTLVIHWGKHEWSAEFMTGS